jgi:Tetracyclin repressor-like, C-terminal domain
VSTIVVDAGRGTNCRRRRAFSAFAEPPRLPAFRIERHYHRQLSRALRGGFAPERAAIILAIVTGVQAMRQVMRPSALAQANPASLTALLTPVFDQLVARPRPARRRRRKPKTD